MIKWSYWDVFEVINKVLWVPYHPMTAHFVLGKYMLPSPALPAITSLLCGPCEIVMENFKDLHVSHATVSSRAPYLPLVSPSDGTRSVGFGMSRLTNFQ